MLTVPIGGKIANLQFMRDWCTVTETLFVSVIDIMSP